MLRVHAIRLLIALSAVAAIGLTTPGIAQAQEDPSGVSLQVEHFEPLANQLHDIWNVATSDMLGHLDWHTGAVFHLSNGLFVLTPADGGDDVKLIDNVFKGEVLASVGLFDVAELGVVIPLALFQSGDDLAPLNRPGETIEGVGLGDIRFILKAVLIKPEQLAGVGLNFTLPISFPSGSEVSYNSESDIRFNPTLGLDWRHAIGLKIAANLGFYVREKRTLLNYAAGSELRWAFGFQAPLGVDGLMAQGNIFGALNTEDNLDPNNPTETIDERNHPAEFLLGVRYDFPFGLNLGVAGGAGITGDVGAPGYRTLLTIAYSDVKVDADNDGVSDDIDACLDKAEDPDGFQDDDGCPDLDNDDDGVPDTEDKCANEAEDEDDFEDEDGCPELDNDGDGVNDDTDQCATEAEDMDGVADEDGCPEDDDADGIADADDKCRAEAEDKDGFEDEDGCPDLDNDGDEVPDTADACADVKEDVDGFQDEDGCPDYDNDGDGLLDAEDQCPDVAEVINLVDDTDGCEDIGASLVSFDGTSIGAKGIAFDKNKATETKGSRVVLDQVAALLTNHKEITQLTIFVYPGGTEDEATRSQLAQSRAETVKAYLVAKGIDEGRIRPAGQRDASLGDTASIVFSVSGRVEPGAK